MLEIFCWFVLPWIVFGYFCWRNHHVYWTRMKLIHEESLPWEERKRRLYAMPSYPAMVFQVWKFSWPDNSPLQTSGPKQ